MREGIEPRLVSPELVGRDAELSTVGRLVGAVSTGATATLLLSGEAGMGKSALLARAREIARRAGFRVLRGECVRFEMGRAFGPFVDALRTVREHPAAAGALAVAPDGEEPSLGGSDRYHAHTAFVRAFAAVAEERPTLLAIDDLHWADESTLELFAHLSRRLPAGALLAGTYRPDEIDRRPALRRAIGDLPRDRTWDLALRRLTASEASRALRLILGETARIPADTREVLQAASAGNPLFLEEILRALAHRGELRQVDGEWRVGRIRHVPLPASVHDAVHERLAGHDPTAREVLLLAATIGERFDLDVLRRAAGAAEAAVVPAIREAVAAQLVLEVEDDRPDRFAFRHPLIRDAILDGVLGVERRTLHRRVAEALEQDGAPDDALSALAYHWDEAGDRGRAFAAHVTAAEREARRFAHAESLAHVERAIALAADDPAVKADLFMRAAAMARVLGRAHRALDHATAASDLSERLGDRRAVSVALLAVHAAAGEMLWPLERRRSLLERALRTLADVGETPELVSAYGALARHLATEGRSADAIVVAERAVEIAERCAGSRTADAYLGLAAIHMKRSDRDATVAALRRAVAAIAVEGLRGPYEINGVAILITLLEGTEGQTDETRSLRRLGNELRERYGTMETYHQRLHRWLMRGEWDEYVRVHDEHADDQSEGTLVHTHQALHRAFIEVARGGPAALATVHVTRGELVRFGEVTESDMVMAEVALLAGDHALVLDVAERSATFVSHPDPTSPFFGFTGIYALLAALESGDVGAARTWLDRFPAGPSVAAAQFHPAIRHAIAYGATERLWAEGQLDAAIGSLCAHIEERKSREWQRSLGPGEAIWPILTYFLALREIDMRVQRGAPDDLHLATERLAWIVDFYRSGRAGWYLERLRERAARWGIPFPADGTAVAAAPRLTGRERQVALLVAKGMTNKEIAEHLTLSVRTAESHVERIRSKLGFRTRAQVASWVTETYGPTS